MKKMRLLPSAVLAVNLLLAAVFFVGCNNKMSNDQKAVKLLQTTGKEVNGYTISIVEFDSCEYLVSGVGYSQMMTHKGNCKFCAARHCR